MLDAGGVVASKFSRKLDTPSDPYYLSRIRMYLDIFNSHLVQLMST
jgi:hypothetical protein